MAEANSYEEQRERQVEKNKRKLEELGLHDLSAAVRQAAAKPTPTKLVMQRNSRLNSPIRRSGRISGLPEQPNYRPEKAQLNGPVPAYATKEERPYAITKAEELRDQLGSDHPSFIKPISHGYATKSDSLKIPMSFMQYLPAHDEMMVLVDEMNNEFDVLYSYKLLRKLGACNHRLNWWKRFAAEHELADGDCLVFQLIERTKFKVYIVRASSYNKNDH